MRYATALLRVLVALAAAVSLASCSGSITEPTGRRPPPQPDDVRPAGQATNAPTTQPVRNP